MSTSSTEKPVPGGKNVLVEFEDGIAWVSLNRPEKRNAMSAELAYEMLAVLEALEGIRQIVLGRQQSKALLLRRGRETPLGSSGSAQSLNHAIGP